MRKIILSLAFLFVFILGSFSQKSDFTFRFGAKGGLAYSDLSSSGGYNYSQYRGYLLGAFTEVSKSDLKNVFLRGGVNFSKRGVKYQNEETTNQYVEIPVQIGYKYPAFSFLNVYALAGPSVHFRTYGNGYLKGFGDSYRTTQKVIAGAEANVGLELFKHIQIEGGYQYGITPDYKASGYSAHNNSFVVTVGLVF